MEFFPNGYNPAFISIFTQIYWCRSNCYNINDKDLYFGKCSMTMEFNSNLDFYSNNTSSIRRHPFITNHINNNNKTVTMTSQIMFVTMERTLFWKRGIKICVICILSISNGHRIYIFRYFCVIKLSIFGVNILQLWKYNNGCNGDVSAPVHHYNFSG